MLRPPAVSASAKHLQTGRRAVEKFTAPRIHGDLDLEAGLEQPFILHQTVNG